MTPTSPQPRSDWKAYAMTFRAHALGHAGQIRKILEELPR